jgi:DNA adenine methylase
MKMIPIAKGLSPYRITGGKSKVLPILHKHMPRRFKEYREPFAGGASFALSLMDNNKDRKYWINDANPNTFNMWNNFHRKPAAMLKWVMDKWRWSNGREDRLQELYTDCKSNIDSAGSFERGCMWYILNRISFNDSLGSFHYESSKRHFTENAIRKIDSAGKLLRRSDVEITDYDYSVLLGGCNGDTFIYVDPPYDCGRIWYGELHKEFKHEVFGMELNDCSAKWMLSYNDIPSIRQRYQKYNTAPFIMNYTTPKQEGKELLIKNY